MRRPVFYSFHFNNDVFRVQQIRNMGVIDGNEPVSANEWEEAKKRSGGIQKWIDDTMKYKQCVIVLIGEKTAEREWVKYEIRKAWASGKGLFGIYIHNLKCPIQGFGKKGPNPFNQFTYNGTNLSNLVPCYDPSPYNAYSDIKNNLSNWVEQAIFSKTRY